jgi:tetratricopeptide (TPR) repeat protein
LLNRLAKVQQLRVTGRTSSFAFRGKAIDLRSIGQQLGVERILEGSVRKQGERLRINAQLIDVRDGSPIWSESYDRQLLDVFAIQDDIAQQVVAAVERAMLGGVPQDGLRQVPTQLTANLDAYTSYLRGKYLLRSRVGKDMEQALVEFQRAATLDPKFALAHVGVANTLVLLADRYYRNIDEVAASADAAITRALELDPQLPEAYAARFLLRSSAGGPRQERMQLIQRAIELNPNDPMTLHWAAGDMLEAGRPGTEILPLRERAYALDPLAPNVISVLAAELYGAGQRERALALAEQIATLSPADGHGIRSNMAWMDGRPDQFLRWTARSLRVQPDDPGALDFLGFSYAELGDTAAAEHAYKRMRRLIPHSAAPVLSLTMTYLEMGDAPRALALLGTAIDHPAYDPNLLRANALYYSYVGATEQALNTFRQSDPLLFGESCEITHPLPYYLTPDVVLAARRGGDMHRASAIAAAFFAFTNNWARPVQKGDPDWMRVRMAAAIGDRAALIEHLDKLYESGAVLPAFVPVEPLFVPYVHDAEIAARLAKHAERRALWRRQLAAEKL